jgi:hypothetical protein
MVTFNKVGQAILDGLIMAARKARAGGDNIDYLGGALSVSQHQALTLRIPWIALVGEVRAALGTEYDDLIDQAVSRMQIQ